MFIHSFRKHPLYDIAPRHRDDADKATVNLTISQEINTGTRESTHCSKCHIPAGRGSSGRLLPPPQGRAHRSLLLIFVRRYDEAIREHDNVTKIGAEKGCCFLRPFMGCIWADPSSSRCSRRRRRLSATPAWSPRRLSYAVAGRSLHRPASLLCGPTAGSFVLRAFFGSISRYPSFQSGVFSVGSAGLTS